MYKCTECKEEFKEKPDYCICGNDEFEEFIPQAKAPEISSQPAISSRKTFDLKKFDMVRIFSIGFFSLCIILSIIPWTIKTEKPVKTEPKPQQQITKTIPDIESFWQNAKSQPAVTERVSEVKETPLPQQKTVNEKKKQPPQPQKPVTAKKPQPKPVSKPAAPAAKPVKKDSPAQTSTETKPKLPQSVLNTGKNAQNSPQKPQSTIAPPEIQKPVQKEEPPKMNPSEFLNYKGSIRSALLAKLNVTAIQGSGDCAVEFSLDNSGKLINRNFIYKSQNKSVNDEVYLMLMRLPYYKQPPAHYNGEKIKLKFLFNNGYYEITFI